MTTTTHMTRQSTARLVALGMALAAVPTLITMAVLLKDPGPSKIQFVDDETIVRRYKAEYAKIIDDRKREDYLAYAHEQLKAVDESKLPKDLCKFVVQVKVSQFASFK